MFLFALQNLQQEVAGDARFRNRRCPRADRQGLFLPTLGSAFKICSTLSPTRIGLSRCTFGSPSRNRMRFVPRTPRRLGRKAWLTSSARSIGRSPPAELPPGRVL